MFERIQKQTLSQRVADALRDAILAGRIEPGGPLPSERKLAEQFGVNRLSIREALRHLDALGLVEIKHGGATKILDYLTSAGIQLVPYLLAPGGELDAALCLDLFEVRSALMSWVAELAAERAEPEDVDKLRSCLDELAAERDPETLQRLDYDFFDIMVSCSRNRVLQLLSNSVRMIYLENGSHFLGLYASLDTEHHRRTLEAIAAGDAAAARAAMEAYARSATAVLERQ